MTLSIENQGNEIAISSVCPAGFLGLSISGETPNHLLLVKELLEQGMSVVPPPHFTCPGRGSGDMVMEMDMVGLAILTSLPISSVVFPTSARNIFVIFLNPKTISQMTDSP